MNRHFKCSTCGEPLTRNERFDAYLCRHCDVWAEEACGSPDCPYCPGRPEKPSGIQPHEENWP